MTCVWAEAQMDLGRPCSIANIVRFTMTCVWAEAQMDLGRPCSIANIVRFTMTCVWAEAQMDLGRTCIFADVAQMDLCRPCAPNLAMRPCDQKRSLLFLSCRHAAIELKVEYTGDWPVVGLLQL